MLELKNLNVFYGDAQAVNDLSLRVEEGSLAALVGANGAGKSTTLMTIAGLLRPRRGMVEFMGKNLHGLRPEEIVERGISLVPEGRWLFTRMTVSENFGSLSCRLATRNFPLDRSALANKQPGEARALGSQKGSKGEV